MKITQSVALYPMTKWLVLEVTENDEVYHMRR